MTYFLGVDGGASKTAALVTDDQGKSLGDGVAGPSNHLRVGIETAARNIERAVNKALVNADVASREIVWAYCGIPLLYRAFYAVGERTLPVRVGLGAVAIDLTCNLTLIWPFAERGLAYSTAVSAAIQVTVLAYLLQHRVGRLDWASLWNTAWRAGISTAVMAATCLMALSLCPTGETTRQQLITLLAPLSAGVISYFVAAHWLGLHELAMLFRRRGDVYTD